jgi:hypothetical protein
MGVALLSLTQLGVQSGYWEIVWRLALVGFGLGLFTSPNNSSVLGSVPRPRLGSASATVAQMRITGQPHPIPHQGADKASATSPGTA